MQIKLNKKPAGVVLIAALAIIVTGGIVVAGYLTLMQAETRNVTRSQTWNECVPVMEAGVEEALAQIYICGTNSNFSMTNNWTSTNGYYSKTRSVGTDGSYCQVLIQPSVPPVIFATAFVPVPASTNYVTREVRVTTKGQRQAMGGMIAKGSIQLKGGGIFDSFDSTLGPYNTANNGLGSNAMALSETNMTGAISLSGGAIYGMAVTTPSGTVTTGGQGTVGPQSYITSANKGTIDPGWWVNDANVQINDVTITTNTNSWNTAFSAGTINGTNYTNVLIDANCALSGGLSLNGQQNLAVQGNCILYVSSLSVSGNGFIYLAPQSSLTIYVGSGGFSVSGGGIINAAGYAANLTILGLPSCTSVSYSGGAPFVGVVNAPEAAFTLGGGADAYGQFTANSIVVSGTGGVHYDQALSQAAFYVANGWNEL